jgi:hypothetical protein
VLRKEDNDPEKVQFNEYFYAGGLAEYVKWLNTDKVFFFLTLIVVVHENVILFFFSPVVGFHREDIIILLRFTFSSIKM